MSPESYYGAKQDSLLQVVLVIHNTVSVTATGRSKYNCGLTKMEVHFSAIVDSQN